MLSGMTRREKLLTFAATAATLLFTIDSFVVAPYRQGVAARQEETSRLAERRLALLPYADESVTIALTRQAESLERQIAPDESRTPAEPTTTFIPRLTDPDGSGTLRLAGLTRAEEDGVETISLSLLADHAGALRLFHRLDHTGANVTDLTLHRTNGVGAPLAVGITLERHER